MTRLRQNPIQAAAVVGLLCAVAALRLLVDDPGPLLLIPVALAGVWFGRAIGLLTGAAAAILFGVLSTLDSHGAEEGLAAATLVRLLVYGGAGWLVGTLAESRLELRRELRERDLELQELRTIQEALAPSEPPERPSLELATCYLAAEHGVSGDFYVVAPAEDGATMIAVGDVAGRGLDAAKRAWYVRTLIASSADVSDDPAAVLERANRALIDEAGFASPFVTVACLLFRPDGRIQWALAGHDQPVRLADGVPLGGSGHAGLPLGVSERLGCETSTTKLAPGGGLLLYTDGLTEARRTNGAPQAIELFGEERIGRVLAEIGDSSSVEVVERVREEVRRFSGGRLADDLCLIAFKVARRPDATEAC